MTDCCTLYVMMPTNKLAVGLCRRLLTERLVACANISADISSLYKWEGNICEEKEVALFLKTTKTQARAAIARITELHPYDTPCIVKWDITDGHKGYLEWVGEMVGPE